MRLPATVTRRIVDAASFYADAARFAALNDAELLSATETCLRNLPRIDEATAAADTDLQLVLVTELWERLRPGTRDTLRRISTTLAEYDPSRSSIFDRLLSPASRVLLCTRATELRQAIARATWLDAGSLAQWTRFAIAGSRAMRRYAPEDCVYEPGFTYRLMPAIVRRVSSLAK